MAGLRRIHRRMSAARARKRARARPSLPSPATQSTRQSIKDRMSETSLSNPLKIGRENAPAEKAADRLAQSALDTYTSPVAPSLNSHATPLSDTQESFTASPPAHQAVKALQGGSPLPAEIRKPFEARLKTDLSPVRLHQGPAADRANRELNAEAFNHKHHIALSKTAPQLNTPKGQSLLAHELSHFALEKGEGPIRRSSDSGKYTEQERENMASGNISGTDRGREMAARMSLEPGDIVFRLGSENLASMIGDPVTHGGIYMGDGKLHDMVGFGNRDVTIENFFAEAADPDVYRVLRFTGPLDNLIIPLVVSNIQARDFRLPTDSVPWNLFSSADDYRTATCLEYAHAQFLYAIWQMTQMPYSEDIIQQLREAYFTGDNAEPDNLIAPKTLERSAPDSAGALLPSVIIGAADYLAEDVDDSVFQNRWEGESQVELLPNYMTYVGTGGGMPPVPRTMTTHTLRAFTYSSFKNATQFFTLVGSN